MCCRPPSPLLPLVGAPWRAVFTAAGARPAARRRSRRPEPLLNNLSLVRDRVVRRHAAFVAVGVCHLAPHAVPKLCGHAVSARRTFHAPCTPPCTPSKRSTATTLPSTCGQALRASRRPQDVSVAAMETRSVSRRLSWLPAARQRLQVSPARRPGWRRPPTPRRRPAHRPHLSCLRPCSDRRSGGRHQRRPERKQPSRPRRSSAGEPWAWGRGTSVSRPAPARQVEGPAPGPAPRSAPPPRSCALQLHAAARPAPTPRPSPHPRSSEYAPEVMEQQLRRTAFSRPETELRRCAAAPRQEQQTARFCCGGVEHSLPLNSSLHKHARPCPAPRPAAC